MKKQLRYDLIESGKLGIRERPCEQMKKMGYTIIDAIPQTIGCQWWFTVDDYREPLPPYLEKMGY